jgi:hypothetical protein
MLVRLLLVLFTLSATMWGGVFYFASDFENGNNEGWTIYTPVQNVVGGTGPTVPLSGGVGNSGYLEAEDAANGFLYFIAPPAWAGDLYGGSLSFYLQNLNENRFTSPGTQPAVRIEGANNTVLYYFNLPGAGGGWTFNQVSLTPGANWRLGTGLGSDAPAAQLVADTLINVTSIGILADWVGRYAGHPLGDFGPDITGLDEVRLVGIPEPSTALLLLAGFGAFAVIRRRA